MPETPEYPSTQKLLKEFHLLRESEGSDFTFNSSLESGSKRHRIDDDAGVEKIVLESVFLDRVGRPLGIGKIRREDMGVGS